MVRPENDPSTMNHHRNIHFCDKGGGGGEVKEMQYQYQGNKYKDREHTDQRSMHK